MSVGIGSSVKDPVSSVDKASVSAVKKDVVKDDADHVKDSVPDITEEADTSQKDSGIGSYENEHWTKIETTECNLVSGADKTKPNFHTTLTMNGLTQELASVLENLDGETTTTTAAAGASESGLNKTPEEILQEALESSGSTSIPEALENSGSPSIPVKQ
ncbi:hypothetical protein KUTeg_013882 [Tegillarca granosa]|uniref:Uncharacterized protein n=1 Tax=Tegillarca granosa TaxID=220873 RepID=A0ABQ9EUZ6_TEGGR|nr:hypothetical protein KUTeg_013882 [Tegillarca granosa]